MISGFQKSLKDIKKIPEFGARWESPNVEKCQRSEPRKLAGHGKQRIDPRL